MSTEGRPKEVAEDADSIEGNSILESLDTHETTTEKDNAGLEHMTLYYSDWYE